MALAVSLIWTAGSGTIALAHELRIPMLHMTGNSALATDDPRFDDEDSAQTLVDLLCAHARHKAGVGGSTLAFGHRMLVPSDIAAPGNRRRHRPIRDRVDFGSFNMPFGHFALVTRELDGYGRLRGIQFLQLHEPGSSWRFQLEVSHGASLRLYRSWRAASNDRPFASHRERAWFGD